MLLKQVLMGLNYTQLLGICPISFWLKVPIIAQTSTVGVSKTVVVL